MSRLALLTLALAACGQDRIEVTHQASNDYNAGALQTAVDAFVTAGRSPEAYAQLAQRVLALRSGFDRTTAEQAELKLMVLALAPMRQYADKPIGERVAALALTVWPTLLGKEIEADEVLRQRDAARADLPPHEGEQPGAYLERLCGKQLAADCKQIVPEHQGEVVGAQAIRHATERVRIAVADCGTCNTDRGWAEAVRGWEALDREANTFIHDVVERADPSNWPIAGPASEPDPGLPEAELLPSGELVVGGAKHDATTRIDALRELRFQHGESTGSIALHLRPELELAKVKALLQDARKSGASRVAVVARGTHYPWERRIYWLADNAGTRAGLRTTDSVQLLLHAVDHLAGPGAIARVD
jgi:hypothetical protein